MYIYAGADQCIYIFKDIYLSCKQILRIRQVFNVQRVYKVIKRILIYIIFQVHQVLTIRSLKLGKHGFLILGQLGGHRLSKVL